MVRNVLAELLLPFLGTSLGAGCVFFIKSGLNRAVQRSLTGFAAGVMVAASVWSLLVPAMEQSADMGRLAFLPAVVGFWLGILFLLILDRAVPHLHQGTSQPEGPHARLKQTTMLVLAVTLHNIPEGMAVGVVLAGYATPGGGDGERAGFSVRRSLRCGGTSGGNADYFGGWVHSARAALSAQFRGGGHDLCGGRGTHPGGLSWGALKFGDAVLCGWVCRYAGTGCGAGVGGRNHGIHLL